MGLPPFSLPSLSLGTMGQNVKELCVRVVDLCKEDRGSAAETFPQPEREIRSKM